jgi:hypothetical protein
MRKNCMLFWKEHKDDTECIHCGRYRYAKMINEDEVSITVYISYAAPQEHKIVNVALHWQDSLGIVFIFFQGRKDLHHV